MGRADYYRKGVWNACCDICGFKRKSSDLLKTWDGLMACADTCWYEKNEQELVRPVYDDSSVVWTRPETPAAYVTTVYRAYPDVNGFVFNGGSIN